MQDNFEHGEPKQLPSTSFLRNQIKKIVLNSGFDTVGIAPVDIHPQDVAFWKLWLVGQNQGDMKYLENPIRETIKNWYPEAKSIIIAALFYKGTFIKVDKKTQRTPDTPSELPSNVSKTQGRIASYAVYKDYHKVIVKKMKKTLEEIRTIEPKIQGKIFVDASPVLERTYAQMAGLGWIGKNTMLINKKKGSYFFLAGMAINLELEKDPPDSMSYCGTCTRCIDQCPTQCITPYTLDASRCISYLTIEKKTLKIEAELAQKTNNWILGCDICQEVCPYNRVQKNQEQDGPTQEINQEEWPQKNKEEAWEPLIKNTLDLKTVLNWEEKNYRIYFAGLPVLRAKWRGFLRNTMMAAANAQDASLIPDLKRWVKNQDKEIAEIAEEAIKKLLSIQKNNNDKKNVTTHVPGALLASPRLRGEAACNAGGGVIFERPG